MNSLEETKQILKMYNIRANKNLGQNFLISDEVIETIVESADINEQDLVIEIGPGLGTLTKKLLEKAGKVICIELDEKMIKILSQRFITSKNLQIINDDILKVDLNKIIKEENRTCKVVANLPYYITTPIIMKLLEEKLDIESITVMIQKEVAERLIATPGSKNTGAITYAIDYYCETEKIIEVPNTSFIPEPKVTSEVIKLKIRDKENINVINKEVMFRVIKSAFMQKRKTLLNALTNAKVFVSKEQGIEVLKNMNLSENVRAEELSLQQFADISNYIVNNIKK